MEGEDGSAKSMVSIVCPGLTETSKLSEVQGQQSMTGDDSLTRRVQTSQSNLMAQVLPTQQATTDEFVRSIHHITHYTPLFVRLSVCLSVTAESSDAPYVIAAICQASADHCLVPYFTVHTTVL